MRIAKLWLFFIAIKCMLEKKAFFLGDGQFFFFLCGCLMFSFGGWFEVWFCFEQYVCIESNLVTRPVLFLLDLF